MNDLNRINGGAQTVEDFGIAFHVYSQTNGCAASDLVLSPGQRAWGVLYKLADEDFEKLKKIEGPRYEPKPIRVRNQAGEEVNATTFLVKPDQRRTGIATSAAYVSWIIYGLRDHGALEEYIAHVIGVAIEANQRAGVRAADQIRLIKTL